MPAFEVSRTLVKSPPEVWAELERSERLAELLGDDAIKITRAEPETKIEWQGSTASGTIEIGASGWGTKVRLTAEAADPPELPRAETEVAKETVAEADRDSDSVAVELAARDEPEPAEQHVPELARDDEPELAEQDSPELSAQDEPVAETRLSIWRRIKQTFSSKPPAAETAPAHEAIVESVPDLEPEPEPEPKPEPESQSKPESQSESEIEPDTAGADADVDADDGSARPVDYESLLTAVLDHLGSAHKRPFTAT